MTRAEYWEAVSKELKNLLPPEKEKVRRELDGHMEDCMEDLTAGGYAPEDAEARAVAVMGDPIETGQAINEQYSAFWLFVNQMAFMLCLVAALLLLRPAMYTVQALRYRGDGMMTQVYSELAEMRPVDGELSMGGDVIECRGVGIYPGWREGQYDVRMVFCQHDRWPWGDIERNLWNGVTFVTSKFPRLNGNARSGGVLWRTDGRVEYYKAEVPVEYGEPSILVRCRYLGQCSEMTIPLDWTGVEP